MVVDISTVIYKSSLFVRIVTTTNIYFGIRPVFFFVRPKVRMDNGTKSRIQRSFTLFLSSF